MGFLDGLIGDALGFLGGIFGGPLGGLIGGSIGNILSGNTSPLNIAETAFGMNVPIFNSSFNNLGDELNRLLIPGYNSVFNSGLSNAFGNLQTINNNPFTSIPQNYAINSYYNDWVNRLGKGNEFSLPSSVLEGASSTAKSGGLGNILGNIDLGHLANTALQLAPLLLMHQHNTGSQDYQSYYNKANEQNQQLIDTANQIKSTGNAIGVNAPLINAISQQIAQKIQSGDFPEAQAVQQEYADLISQIKDKYAAMGASGSTQENAEIARVLAQQQLALGQLAQQYITSFIELTKTGSATSEGILNALATAANISTQEAADMVKAAIAQNAEAAQSWAQIAEVAGAVLGGGKK